MFVTMLLVVVVVFDFPWPKLVVTKFSIELLAYVVICGNGNEVVVIGSKVVLLNEENDVDGDTFAVPDCTNVSVSDRVVMPCVVIIMPGDVVVIPGDVVVMPDVVIVLVSSVEVFRSKMDDVAKKMENLLRYLCNIK